MKNKRWLIGGVLFVAVAAFVSLSLLPFLGPWIAARSSPQEIQANAAQGGPDPVNQQSELETRAKGYQLVLQREPDNQTALRGLVDARIQLGDLEGVIEPLDHLAALNPDVTDYKILLGQTKFQVGDLEGSAQAYRNVLTASPGNTDALRGLVALLMTQERPQAAIGLLQDTLSTANQANEIQAGSVDVTSVQLLLGQVYAEEGRYEESINTYEAAIAVAQQDFRPVLGKALVLQQQGNNDEAQPLFANAAALAPDQFKDQIQQLALGAPTPPPTAESAETESAPSSDLENAAAASESGETPSGN
ncbi:MAG: tetratricopeptide repeat protein [Leptolyngbyaceae cyanobacterium MO_188.B28]|nr:tetratricopeptide repeat protein [Leptolyngbyaceae cyanobacterium MO_188.B28]